METPARLQPGPAACPPGSRSLQGFGVSGRFFCLCILVVQNLPWSIKSALTPQMFEIIKYNYSAAILMTLILFCFSSFLKFNSVSLGYLLLCVAWEFHYFLSRDFAVSGRYFKRMKHAVYPQESCD